MKKKSLWLITALMTIALLGVFVMQLYYIREAYNLKSQLFEQNVNEALNDVASKVQKRYAANHLTKKDFEIRMKRERDFRLRTQQIVEFKERYKEEEEQRKLDQQRRIIEDLNMRDSLVRVNFPAPQVISEEVFQEITNLDVNKGSSSLQVQVDVGVDNFGIVRGKINVTIIPKKSATFTLLPGRLPDSIRYLAYNPRNLTPITITLEQVTAQSAVKFRNEDRIAKRKYMDELRRLMQDTAINDDENVMEVGGLKYLEDVRNEMRQVNVPIEKRVPKDDLDTLLKKELLNRNISLSYDFWLKLANKDSLLYSPAAQITGAENSENIYRIPLFGNDIFGDPGMLFVSFPNKNSLILSNMWATMASSAGLLLVLIFIFAYTLYAIL